MIKDSAMFVGIQNFKTFSIRRCTGMWFLRCEVNVQCYILLTQDIHLFKHSAYAIWKTEHLFSRLLKNTAEYEAWDFHSDEDSSCSLLACSTMWWYCRIPIFERTMLLQSSGWSLKMEAAWSTEMWVSYYTTTHCYNPEDSDLHFRMIFKI
jgi:hypothetical protein